MAKKKKTGVEELLEKNGNGFHSRVVNQLREQTWTVQVSPYYSDNFTDKPREIDIIAERVFQVREVFDQFLGIMKVRLFVECKYVLGDTVFWFDGKDDAAARRHVLHISGTSEPNDLIVQGYHYLDSVPVAKLFASEKGREDNEWMSRAINQILNALVYYRNKSDIIPHRDHVQVLHRISFPIIVVNSFENFYKMDMSTPDAPPVKITEPFQLEVNYAYKDEENKPRDEYFLIDVVSFDTLLAHLTVIEQRDITSVMGRLQWDARMREANNQRRSSGNNSNR